MSSSDINPPQRRSTQCVGAELRQSPKFRHFPGLSGAAGVPVPDNASDTLLTAAGGPTRLAIRHRHESG